MSLMPRGSDEIAGLLGVGALVGALSGARPPKRGSRPGLISTLLARSMEEERLAQDARMRQEQAQVAFLGSIAPKMLEMGIPMGEIFNDDVYARLGVNPAEMNRAIATAATRSMVPILQQYAPHATEEQLADVTAGDWVRLAEFYASDANRDAHRNVATFPALMAQLGSAGGLKAMSGLSPDGRVAARDGSMFSDTGGFLSILGEGLQRAADQEFRRADALDANSMGRRLNLSREQHQQSIERTDREVAGRIALEAIKNGVFGDLNNPQKTIGNIIEAKNNGYMTAQEAALAKEKQEADEAFTKELTAFVLPWFSAPKGSSGDAAADAAFWERAGLAVKQPSEQMKKGAAFIIEKHYPKLSKYGLNEEDILKWTDKIGIPAYGPGMVKRQIDRIFGEIEAKASEGDQQVRKHFLDNQKELYRELQKKVVEEFSKSGGIVYGVL